MEFAIQEMETADMAVRMASGESTVQITVVQFVPKVLVINQTAIVLGIAHNLVENARKPVQIPISHKIVLIQESAKTDVKLADGANDVQTHA